jgi:alginate O-acetyltransferase complex protein AlgI
MLEFWRRWHMTLTSWMTDYIFMPLGMALRNYGMPALVFSITVTMTVIGLWHGFTVNFLIFGLLHAAIVAATRLTQTLRDKLFGSGSAATHVRYWGGITMTWILILLPQIFWHKPDLAGALAHLRLLFGVQPAGPLGLSDIPTEISESVVICAILSLYIGAGSPGLREIGKLLCWQRLPDWALCGLALFLIAALAPEAGSHFIYGQF